MDIANVALAVIILFIIVITILLGIRKPKVPTQAEQKYKNDGRDSSVNVRTPSDFRLSSDQIGWIEREILEFNQKIFGEDRPPEDANFFQTIPKVLFESEYLSPKNVADAAENLLQQTVTHLRRHKIQYWDIPFRKPKVVFTSDLPSNEPGHIEIKDDVTIIRIHPKFAEDPFAISAILCHELAHFILDHNGLRRVITNENERLTDLFVFKCGQGLIYLQGIVDLEEENGKQIETQLGYLTINEMAYAHTRCASQFGLSASAIAPNHFKGKGFSATNNAIAFLKLRKSNDLAEIILCPNQHILRVSRNQPSQHIRCPKCGWQRTVWFRKEDHFSSLILDGTKWFDTGNYSQALEIFRSAENINRGDSSSYCWASRCLKRLGKHQEAIRELTKVLSIRPEDERAQEEMKRLIY